MNLSLETVAFLYSHGSGNGPARRGMARQGWASRGSWHGVARPGMARQVAGGLYRNNSEGVRSLSLVKATILNDKIICGKCGHKIAEKKGIIQSLGKGVIYLKCKHRDNGVNCNMVNEIEVN